MANNPPHQRIGFSNHLCWSIVNAFAGATHADKVIGITRIAVTATALVIFKQGKIRLPGIILITGTQAQIVIIFQTEVVVAAEEKVVGIVGLVAKGHFNDARASDNGGGKLITDPGVMNNVHIVVMPILGGQDHAADFAIKIEPQSVQFHYAALLFVTSVILSMAVLETQGTAQTDRFFRFWSRFTVGRLLL